MRLDDFGQMIVYFVRLVRPVHQCIKTGERRIMRLDVVNRLVRLQRRTK